MVVNLKTVFKENLTLEQYFFLTCLIIKEEDLLKLYANSVKQFNKEEILNLVEKKYLEKTNQSSINLDNLKPTEKAYLMMGYTKKDEWFNELWENYPRLTPNGRILKQISKVKAQKKYLSKIKNEDDHLNVLKCLEKELQHRQQTNKLDYMQQMETWLNNESWKAYEEIQDIIEQPKKLYGTNIE